MSIKVMTLVWDVFPASGSELLAMLALADWCDDQGGSLYPSMRAVAQKIRVSEKQARRIVQGFVTGGYLSVVGNHAGGAPGSTKQFRLDVAKLAALPVAGAQKGAAPAVVDTPPTGVTPPTGGSPTPPTGGSRTPPMGVREGSHPCPERAPMGGSLTVIEPSIEPSVGGERAQAHAPATDGVGVVDVVVDQVAKASPAKRKSACPADFVPDATAVDLARDLRVSLDDELASFVDHHAAIGSTMVDWQAALRVWLRNAAKFAKRDAARGLGAGGSGGPAETGYQRAMRERAEEVAPQVARKAPARRMGDAVAFFDTLEAAPVVRPAPALRIGG